MSTEAQRRAEQAHLDSLIAQMTPEELVKFRRYEKKCDIIGIVASIAIIICAFVACSYISGCAPADPKGAAPMWSAGEAVKLKLNGKKAQIRFWSSGMNQYSVRYADDMNQLHDIYAFPSELESQ